MKGVSFGRKFKNMTKEEFAKEYYSRPTCELRELWGVSDFAIHRWRVLYGLSLRPRLRPDLAKWNAGRDRSGENNGNFGKRKEDPIDQRTIRKYWGSSFSKYVWKSHWDLRGDLLRVCLDVCVLCGEVGWKGTCDVHHIDYDSNNNSINNVVLLCQSCHVCTNRLKNRYLWKMIFEKIVSRRLNEGGDVPART